jgi:hypothetical protein
MSRHPARPGILAAIVGACLLAACLPGGSTAAEPRPIEGHEKWKLGMTKDEAQAAEPRAEPKDCPGGTCLHYADERFPTADVDVSARFTEDGFLDVIVVVMKPQPGDNRCRRISAQLAAFYTASHGETMPVSGEAWVWTTPKASLTLLNHCDGDASGGGEDTINILFEALGHPNPAAQ